MAEKAQETGPMLGLAKAILTHFVWCLFVYNTSTKAASSFKLGGTNAEDHHGTIRKMPGDKRSDRS
jgi:hypothetical protein